MEKDLFIKDISDEERDIYSKEISDKRNDVMTKIKFYNSILNGLYSELDMINKASCLINGHDFGKYQKYGDAFVRRCKVCGTTQQTFDKPDEFIDFDNLIRVKK